MSASCRLVAAQDPPAAAIAGKTGTHFKCKTSQKKTAPGHLGMKDPPFGYPCFPNPTASNNPTHPKKNRASCDNRQGERAVMRQQTTLVHRPGVGNFWPEHVSGFFGRKNKGPGHTIAQNPPGGFWPRGGVGRKGGLPGAGKFLDFEIFSKCPRPPPRVADPLLLEG